MTKIKVGDEVSVVQSFEPIPLYATMADRGFEHLTEKVAVGEYRVYFVRVEEKETTFSGAGDMPLKPTAILNFKTNTLMENFEKNPDVDVVCQDRTQ